MIIRGKNDVRERVPAKWTHFSISFKASYETPAASQHVSHAREAHGRARQRENNTHLISVNIVSSLPGHAIAGAPPRFSGRARPSIFNISLMYLIIITMTMIIISCVLLLLIFYLLRNESTTKVCAIIEYRCNSSIFCPAIGYSCARTEAAWREYIFQLYSNLFTSFDCLSFYLCDDVIIVLVMDPFPQTVKSNVIVVQRESHCVVYFDRMLSMFV